MNKATRFALLIFVAVLCSCFATHGYAAELYVATDGNDAWSGVLKQANAARSDGPLASLVGARDRLRALRRAGKLVGPTTVYLLGGTYRVETPLVLAPQDSGTADAPVLFAAAPGAKVVLSGGRRITGLRPGPGPGPGAGPGGNRGVWQADLPEVARGAWRFRHLWVDGRWASRPRAPATGTFPIAAGGNPDASSFHYRAGDFRDTWTRQRDMEVVVLQFWTEARLPLAQVEAATRRFSFQGGSWRPLTWSTGYYIDNVYESLGAPGQWYLDRTAGKLLYVPRPQDRPETLEAIAPRAEQLVRLEGDPLSNQYVAHVHFRGLGFAHTAWRLPEQGLACPQAELPVTAMFFARGARSCAIEQCEFFDANSCAVELAAGCVGNRIVGNTFRDLGAGGIKVGDYTALLTEGSGASARPAGFRDLCEIARDNVITDNLFRDGAKEYFGAVAVWIGQSSGNLVAHNEMCGTWQWAVSVGWNWGYGPDFTRDNRVEFNHVHHIGTVLGSHSSIYTLGIQPGTVVRNNHVHHSPGYGLGFDQASTGVLAENNLVHHQASGGLHFNWDCLGNIVQNNIFALNGGPEQGQWTRYGDAPRGEDPNCNVLMRNIVYWNAGPLWNEKKWPNFRTVVDFNLYFDASGKPVRPLGLSWDEWKTKSATGGFLLDYHSVIADPKFVDPAKDDFRLKADSPAPRIGFRPFDLTGVGPRDRKPR